MARVTGTILFITYAVFLSAILLFSLLWDNKGDISMWDKSFRAWLHIYSLLAAVISVIYISWQCATAKDQTVAFWLAIALIMLHTSIIMFTLEGEAIHYLGIPIIFLAIGTWLWRLAMLSLNKALNTDADKAPRPLA